MRSSAERGDRAQGAEPEQTAGGERDRDLGRAGARCATTSVASAVPTASSGERTANTFQRSMSSATSGTRTRGEQRDRARAARGGRRSADAATRRGSAAGRRRRRRGAAATPSAVAVGRTRRGGAARRRPAAERRAGSGVRRRRAAGSRAGSAGGSARSAARSAAAGGGGEVSPGVGPVGAARVGRPVSAAGCRSVGAVGRLRRCPGRCPVDRRSRSRACVSRSCGRRWRCGAGRRRVGGSGSRASRRQRGPSSAIRISSSSSQAAVADCGRSCRLLGRQPLDPGRDVAGRRRPPPPPAGAAR